MPGVFGYSSATANVIFVLIALGILFLILGGVWLRKRRYAQMAAKGVVCPAVVAGFEEVENGRTRSSVMYVRAQTPGGEKLLASHSGYNTFPYGQNSIYRQGDTLDVYYNERYPTHFLTATADTPEKEMNGWRAPMKPRSALIFTLVYWAAGALLFLALYNNWIRL